MHRRAIAYVIALCITAPAHAAIKVWDGGGANNNFSNAANWSNLFGAPANDGTDDIIMSGTTRLTPFVDIDFDINSLMFNSAAGPFVFQAGGEPLFIRGGGITNNDADLQIVSRVTLGANQTWNAAAGPLNVNFVTLGGLTGGRVLTITGGFDVTSNGVISPSPLSGGGSIIFNSSANFMMAGAAGQSNTFTGPVTVNSGTLLLNKSGATAIAGNLVIGDGAGSDIVRLVQSNQIVDTSNITINSSGVFNVNGRAETIANLTMSGGGSSVNFAGGTLAAVGVVTLTGTTINSGTGLFQADGTIQTSASANPSVLAGRLANAPQFMVADGPAADDLQLKATLVNPGVATKRGTGQMIFDAASGAYQQFIAAEGTVIAHKLPALFTRAGDFIGAPGSDVVRFVPGGSFGGSSSQIRATSSGWIDLNGSFLEVEQANLDGGRVTTGNGTLMISGAPEAEPDLRVNELMLAGPYTSSIEGNLWLNHNLGGTAFDFEVTNSLQSSLELDLICGITGVPLQQAVTVRLVGTGATRMSGDKPNTVFAWQQVDGVLILGKSIANSSVRRIEVGGTLQLAANEQIADNVGTFVPSVSIVTGGTFDLDGFSETINSISIASGTVTTDGGTLSIHDGITTSGATTSTIAGNVAFASNGAHVLAIPNSVNGADMLLSASLAGAGTISKQGTGELVLSGNSTCTGQIEVLDGTLTLASSTALGIGTLRPSTGTTLRSQSAELFIGNALNVAGDITIDAQSAMNWMGALNNPLTITKTGPATLSFAGPQSHGVGAVASIMNGTVRLVTDAGAAGANLTVNLNAATTRLVAAGTQHLAALNVNAGTAAIESGGAEKVLVTKSLIVDTTDALIDVWEHAIVVDYTGGTVMPSVQSAIVSARNGGAWNGFGITSSAAAMNPIHNTTLGVVEGAAYRAIFGPSATFEGEAVDDTSVLVKYTYYGDTDLNGIVNFDDYARIDTGFNNGLSGWINGDFDLSNVINFDDYALIDLAFNTQTGPLSSPVPEPALLVLGGLAALAASARRRRA